MGTTSSDALPAHCKKSSKQLAASLLSDVCGACVRKKFALPANNPTALSTGPKRATKKQSVHSAV
jgi:hypothetical protein